MSRECHIMPELHDRVISFILRLHQSHDAGIGKLRIEEVIQLLGAELHPEVATQLRHRGDLSFKRDDETGGTFANIGDELSFFLPPAHFKIPAEVSGSYLISPDAVSLSFDSTHTVVGRVFLFAAKLQDIRCDLHRLDVDLSGDSFDQCIIHG